MVVERMLTRKKQNDTVRGSLIAQSWADKEGSTVKPVDITFFDYAGFVGGLDWVERLSLLSIVWHVQDLPIFLLGNSHCVRPFFPMLALQSSNHRLSCFL